MLWKFYAIWIPSPHTLVTMATLQTRPVFLRQVAEVLALPPPPPLFHVGGGGDCGHKTACEPARWGPNIQNLHFISILVKFITATVPSIVPFTSVGRALSGSTWKPKTFKGESVYFHNITYQLHFKTTMLFPERNICPLAPFFMKYFILLYLRVSQWVLCKSRWRFLYDEGQPHY